MESGREEAASLSLSSLAHQQDEEEEIASDDAVGDENDGSSEEMDADDVSITTPRCVPRRPRRTMGRGAPAARQRVVQLAGPGQALARLASPSPSSRRGEAFMTHLPDSPPRGILSRATIFQFAGSQPKEQVMNDSGEDEAEVEGEDNEEEVEEETSLEEQRPEVDESQEEKMEKEDEEEASGCSSGGPHTLDIQPSPMVDSFDDSDTTENEEEVDEREAEEYRHAMEARARFEAEQRERDELRVELETYVASLPSRCDADGDKLIEFPRNFQQIVSLMTAQDIATHSSASVATAGGDGKSWSQVLIQNSLARQQAFGTLDESEGAADGGSSLEAKIALKMARIRQLDAILEETLGKNLYTATGASRKPTKRLLVNPQEPEAVASRRSLLSEPRKPMSVSCSNPPSQTSQLATNHIERNRQIVGNGANANLTRAEECRVKRLLRGSREAREGAADGADAAATEFRLDQQQQDEIEKLISEKRGLYPSAVIMALDDISEEEERAPTLLNPSGRKQSRRRVHETKHERLARQRLERIDEELKFLHAHESVPILPDDEEDDASDGCASERSFLTTTSMLSTASSRSGVTRRQLDQFVAAEVTKSEDTVEAKASHEEIQALLRSLAHLPMATSRPTTTTTV